MDGEKNSGSPELMGASTPLLRHDPISSPKHLGLRLFVRLQLLSSFLICFISEGYQKSHEHEKALDL